MKIEDVPQCRIWTKKWATSIEILVFKVKVSEISGFGRFWNFT